MRRALDAAVDPADVAFCRYQLGELAWQTGRLDAASRRVRRRPRRRPVVPAAARRAGAKLAAARGRTGEALAGYADLTARYPAPAYLIEYAELLRAVGQPAPRRRATRRSPPPRCGSSPRTAARTTSAPRSSLSPRIGRPTPYAAARREWSRRHFADVADVLGWALHRGGLDAQALGYARRASALGARQRRVTCSTSG